MKDTTRKVSSKPEGLAFGSEMGFHSGKNKSLRLSEGCGALQEPEPQLCYCNRSEEQCDPLIADGDGAERLSLHKPALICETRETGLSEIYIRALAPTRP